MLLHRHLSAVAAFALLAAPIAAFAETKLAYVDYQRVLTEVEEGKAAKKRLQSWLESRQKEIDSQQEGLRKEQEVLQKQASAMSEETRQKKAAELQRKVMELAQRYEKSRGEAAERERREMEPIIGKIDQVIGKIAERDGLAMVFEKRDSGLVFALAQYDITNEVVRNYNQLPKSKPAGKKDAPKPEAKAPAGKK